MYHRDDGFKVCGQESLLKGEEDSLHRSMETEMEGKRSGISFLYNPINVPRESVEPEEL